jgi:hypothetical protein
MKTDESLAAYNRALEALDRLYLSRTGKPYQAARSTGTEEERMALLKRRIIEEKIWPLCAEIFSIQVLKKPGPCPQDDFCGIRLAELAEAVAKTAEMCLSSPKSEPIRRTLAELEDSCAYYDIDTNERLRLGDEDIFATIQKMERRFVLDNNSDLPGEMDGGHAFIFGQTIDREDDFWLRAKVRRGNESVFSFGVVPLFGRQCLCVQRLRKNTVAALCRCRKSIPDAAAHYSAESRLAEVQILRENFLSGRERLVREISDLRPLCCGNYSISVLAARRCGALLLHDDSPDLEAKIEEEWQKIRTNHPNVLGDMQLIQNALYHNAGVVTKDGGAKKMAVYCGLKWVNF